MDKLELEIAGCLRRLLRSRYVLRARGERWYRAIIDHRQRLESFATALAATIEINEPLGIAYLRPLSEEIEESLGMRLSRARDLSPFATALCLFLRWKRMQYYLEPTGGDLPVIGVLEMREFLQQFSRAKIDHQFERQFRRCLDEVSELQIVLETAEGSGYFEITSLCDLLLPADQIQELRCRAEAYFARVGNAAEIIAEAGES